MAADSTTPDDGNEYTATTLRNPESEPPTPQGIMPFVGQLRTTPGGIVWHVILGVNLLLFGFLLASNIEAGITQIVAPESEAAKEFEEALVNAGPAALWVSTMAVFLITGVVPLAWAFGAHVHRWQGVRWRLGLHTHRLQRDIAIGGGIAAAMFFLIIGLSAVLAARGLVDLSDPKANPSVTALVEHLTWPLAFATAFAAGVGEEILFRGVLQRWTRWWGQGILFAAAHFTGGFVPQIIFSLVVGLAFGYLRHRGLSLWALIVAHFLYDFTALALALLGVE